MSAEQNSLIAKRAVFFIGGYDPKSADAFFNRQAREIGRFEMLWDVSTKEVNRTQVDDDTTLVQYESGGTTQGRKWQVCTDFHFMTLDDIVLKRFADPLHKRLSRYMSTFFDYVGSGTVQKFIHHAWRFSLYFFYPFLMLLGAVVISFATAILFAATGIAPTWLFGPLVFLLTLATCLKLGSNRYHVLHLMDLWSFSRDYLYGKQKRMDQKLDAFASLIARAGGKQEYDEIILIGHSTGGALILDATGRAFEQSQNFAEGRTKVYVLTVGSTALKIGLHPAADWFRKRLSNTFSSSGIQWIEYQCLSDVINFYKSDPAKLMGFGSEMRAEPLIDNVRIKRMVADPAYTRMRWHFFRIHYQFVFGNTLKYHYDYPAIVHGPSSLLDRALQPKDFDVSFAGTTLHEKENV